jgi:tetratricopeptide (TPR) repeat protein
MIKDFLKRPLFHVLLVIILSLIAYSNTFHVPFQFDDKPVIVENPIIKDLQFFVEPSKAKDFKGRFEYNTYKRRYIGYLTFALNYKIHGLNVPGYHIVNLLIHISNALLIYLLVILSFKTPLLKKSPTNNYSKHIAVATALLFACHPLQTQAVTYIWQRVTSLATLLYILSLVTYVKWRIINQVTEQRQKTLHLKSVPWYLASLLSAVLAMKTKEIAFMLPLVVTMYELMFFEGKLKRRILHVLPLLLTMLIIPFTLINIDQPVEELIGDVSEVARGVTHLSRWEYLLAEFRVIVTYIRLIFAPVHQNLDYDYPRFHSFLDPEVFLSFLLLLSIASFGIYLVYKYRNTALYTRLISFGIFWFFINLLLESSIIPLNNVIFEHRMYLPSIGVFLALSASLFIGGEKLWDRWKGMGGAVVGVLAIIVVVLTGTTYARNSVWGDTLSLWQDVVKKSPNKARGHNNLGTAYESRELLEEAIEQYSIAIKLDNTFASAYLNLGSAYKSMGLLEEAKKYYLQVIKIDSSRYEAYYNIGNAYLREGFSDKAIEHYKRAIDLNPNFADVYVNLGIAYASQGSMREVMELFKTAIEIKPDYPEAHYNLGKAYQLEGFLDKSVEHYKIAIAIKPQYPEAHLNLGFAYQSEGLMDQANKHFKIARQLNSTMFKGNKTQN